jgi:AAA family ATP:ADP antiporter
LSKQDRYVSKGFIDTVLFRFSDVVAGQLCSSLSRSGLPLGWSALLLTPVLFVWLAISWTLGYRHDRANKRADPT